MHPVGTDAVRDADLAHAEMGAAFRRILASIARIEERRFLEDGARDAAHWLSMRYGISLWKARRWLIAAEALPRLPEIEDALVSGALGVDKVLELCRFATAETEDDLIAWATRVSCRTVRERGDAEARRSRDEVAEVERSRYLEWWHTDEGRRLALQAELPAAEGASVVRAIERLAARVPEMPEEHGGAFAPARRADALVALCSAAVAADPDPDRATVVVHAELDALRAGGGALLEDGGVVAAPTVERLACTSRVQLIAEERSNGTARPGEPTRLAPAWMLRQIRYRDRGCRFPGCGARRFTEAHHVRFWRDGGTTTLDNLVLICSFHHRSVHEHGWRIERDSGGDLRWRRPDATPYLGAGPPAEAGAYGATVDADPG